VLHLSGDWTNGNADAFHHHFGRDAH
jgi:hypothetical protein